MKIENISFQIRGTKILVSNETIRGSIEEILGAPDDIGGISQKHLKGRILKYDGIEFHFDGSLNTSRCVLVYSETKDGIPHISAPLAGKDA